MSEKLITFETRTLAYEKGFKESNPNPNYSHTTQSHLQTWLRQEHNIYVIVEFVDEHEYLYDEKWEGRSDVFQSYIRVLSNDKKDVIDEGWSNWYDTYEETLEEGLFLALKQIEL